MVEEIRYSHGQGISHFFGYPNFFCHTKMLHHQRLSSQAIRQGIAKTSRLRHGKCSWVKPLLISTATGRHDVYIRDSIRKAASNTSVRRARSRKRGREEQARAVVRDEIKLPIPYQQIGSP